METTRKRKVLIVGGSRGLGLALASHFCRRGHETVILSRRAPCAAIDAEIISDDAAHAGIAEQRLREIDPNLLIVNFALGIYRRPETLTDAEIGRGIEINATGAIRWLSAAIRLLPPGARIGWISSLTALVPDEIWAIYAATKTAVNHFIECVRPQAAQRGIRLTVCYPGCLQTDFHRAAGAENAPPEAAAPDDIAGALGAAIEDGLEFWAAEMDAVAVERYYELRRQFSASAEGKLR